MKLIFTKHAMDRINTRGVLLKDVAHCLSQPDKILEESSLIKLFFKKIEDNKLLILVCSILNDECKIITVIKTSKISKYL